MLDKKCNIHREVSGNRYVVCWYMVSERSVCIRRCCVGELLYMLKGATLTGLECSYDVRQAYSLYCEIFPIRGHCWMCEV